MMCPVCKRELAPTLSICLTCGAMMNDTVREELETQIRRPGMNDAAAAAKPVADPPIETAARPQAVAMPSAAMDVPVSRSEPSPALPKKKVVTTELARDTSPTLIDFQKKNNSVPDWRLQLQNSVRRRTGGAVTAAAPAPTPSSITAAAPSAGAAVDIPEIRSDKVANALKRIEESRRMFASGQAAGAAAAAAARARKPALPNRERPFEVVERTSRPAPPAVKPPIAAAPKPTLVPPPVKTKGFDTNKLPPIPEPSTALPQTPASPGLFDTASEETEIRRFERVRIDVIEEPDVSLTIDEEYEEIDDLAPMSMRFGAAVFDLIIGVFAAAILLSPFLVSSQAVTSVAGFLALAGAALLVMFLYLTASIGFAGRTVGMKLFSLEIIDAEANELPTLHQAAVNSAVYLLSLIFAGIGILPAFFNEERRAVHDLLSGTILIREYQ